MPRKLFLMFVLSLLCVRANAYSAVGNPQTVSFPSGDETLKGYLWVPEGKGPFRAIVWSNGKMQPLFKQGPPSQFSALAKLYVENSYVLFIPDRSDNERSGKNREVTFLESTTSLNHDVIAALSWVRQQSFVDAAKVAVSGTLTGALQSLMAVERDATIRAAVVFSPGSISWDTKPELRTILQRAVENTEVPIFLIQAQNDHSLKPSEMLGRMLAERRGFNRSKIYPPFAGDVRNFGLDAVDTWGKDVLEFLDATMK